MASKPEIERQKWEDAHTRYWPRFRTAVEAAATCDDAVRVMQHAPPEGAIGRRFYSNLGFFLQSKFAIPDGAAAVERGLYAGLIQRLDEAGQLKPGVRDRVERAIASIPPLP
jgi:hypothetical protein